MKATWTAFALGLSELKHYLLGLQLEWKLLSATTAEPPCSDADALAAELQTHLGIAVTKRRYDYNSIVITLYGLIEQFIEGLLRAYAQRVNVLTPKYAELPESLRTTHLQATFTLINRLEHRRFAGHLTVEELISNLHSCLSGGGYRLNVDAFTLHSANFRQEVVNTVFSSVGVANVCERLRHYPPLSEFLRAAHPERDATTLELGQAFYYLNDLADRRNEVAHGQPSDLLSNDLLTDYIQFAEAFGSALYQLVFCETIQAEVKARGVPLGAPLTVYNNTIVCFELNNIAVKEGDTLVAFTNSPNRPLIAGEIVEIQIDGNRVKTIQATDQLRVALRVEFRTKPTHNFSLLPT